MVTRQQLISVLDLACLSDDSNAYHVNEYCLRANTPDGWVAGLCVYPNFIRQAKQALPDLVAVVAVINFPYPIDDQSLVLAQLAQALADGASEVDMVFPYHEWQAGNHHTKILANIAEIKKHCGDNHKLKVILETGAFEDEKLLYRACIALIEQGVDFLKTSTGKIAIGATPQKTSVLLQAIADTKIPVGCKVSGGIKTLIDAKKYWQLAENILQTELNKNNFRLGSSQIWP